MPKCVIEEKFPVPENYHLPTNSSKPSRRNPARVLSNLGPQIQWVESYVMDDRVYCVYIAANEELIREHARQVRFSREPDFRGPRDYRSDHCRVGGALIIQARSSATQFVLSANRRYLMLAWGIAPGIAYHIKR